MNFREKFSVALLSLGLILALLPLSSGRSFVVKPHNLLPELLDNNTYLSVDQVAKYIVNEDSTILLIDLRTAEEFKKISIPGSINISYNTFLDNDPTGILKDGDFKNILYSNGDINANSALVLAKGLNINNVFVMKGGLNEWFGTIMNSTFTGEKISARENALYETRTRARNMFNEINSLPDSLKMKYFEGKKGEAKKLDGGCE